MAAGMADSSTMYEVAVPDAVPPETHRQGAFTLYRISVQARTRGSVSVALPRTMSWSCDKRYSDFVTLRQGLARIRQPPQAVAAVRALPALPPKVWLVGNLDPALVETRREMLARLMQRVVEVPGGAAAQLVAAFLEQPAELLMSSDEEDPVDEEAAAERTQRRRLAVLAQAERLIPELYDADAVTARELLDFLLQNADPAFLSSRRLDAGPPELLARECSRGRIVRAFKRLVAQLRCDVDPAAAAPATDNRPAAALRAVREPCATKWHHTRRRLPTVGWSRFTDTDSIEAYYHAPTGMVTYEHVMLAGKLGRVAELRGEIQRASEPSASSSGTEDSGGVAVEHQQRELDAEVAGVEREAAQVAEAANLEAEVHTLRRKRANDAVVPAADRQQEGIAGAPASEPRASRSLVSALPEPEPEPGPDSDPPAMTLDLNGTCKDCLPALFSFAFSNAFGTPRGSERLPT
jgi:hypothetical protein